MIEEIDKILTEAETKMKASVEATQRELSTIRTGVANAAILANVTVEAYGTRLKLNEVATISTPEPRLLMVTPWDKSLVPQVERAILTSDLGLTPTSDGAIIRIPIPALTEERRKELARLVSKKVEEGKVAVRNVRREANEKLRALEKQHKIGEDDLKRAMDDVQELTDKHVEMLDEAQKAKQEEILQA